MSVLHGRTQPRSFASLDFPTAWQRLLSQRLGWPHNLRHCVLPELSGFTLSRMSQLADHPILRDLELAIQAKGDFPAVSDSVWRIVAAMDLEEESFDLAEAIMADVALTQRVLRTVNSAFYAAFGQNITSIRQAIVVLGYQAIGSMALALKLSAELQHAAQHKDSRSRLALARSSVAGALAREFTSRHRLEWAEEAGVHALMNRLGCLLLVFYLPDRWNEVEVAIEVDGHTEDKAVYLTLGISAAQIGQAFARHWRLPERLVASLKPGGLEALRERRPAGARVVGAAPNWLEQVVKASNALAEELARHGKNPDSATTADWIHRHASGLGLGKSALLEAFNGALRSGESQRLIQEAQTHRAAVVRAASQTGQHAIVNTGAQLSTLLDQVGREAEGHSLRSLAHLLAETLQRAMRSRRVLFLMREGTTRSLRARFGVGLLSQQLIGLLSLPIETPTPDAFQIALKKGLPVMILDPAPLEKADRLPSSYTSTIKDHPSFLVVPLIFKERPYGMIYIDWARDSWTPQLDPNALEALGRVCKMLNSALARANAS